ncbi:MAG: hypothetical protein EXS15_05155 [Phycisphaerales bacterium]|nr:hypothetical protein [Phycisphaerales bacterium]
MTAPKQGARVTAADAGLLHAALDEAFGYRGDVTICTTDGRRIDGYVFDRRSGQTLDDSIVRILTATSETRVVVKYSEIDALEFTGRDTAAGKSWENWIRKYAQKKAAGESAEIPCDTLD